MTARVDRPPPDGRQPQRFVDLDGCFNFRDLGGYPSTDGRSVRWRRLYRSDGLHRLTPHGWAAFARLGVATVLDLRTPAEIADGSYLPPPGWAGRCQNLPLLVRPPDWSTLTAAELADRDFAANHYFTTTRSSAAMLRAAVEALAEPGGLPVVFHCAAGKDRTGVLAALVLRLLGVPPGVVAEDYALSDEATARWEASVRAGAPDDTRAAWPHVPAAMLVADRATMLGFLRRIDAEYGSVEGFAAHLGLASATIDRLRDELLESPTP